MNHSAYRGEFVDAFGSCSPNTHDSTGFICNLSCISFLFFLCSDGLTAGLEWEKDSRLALLLSPLCIFSSLLSVAFLLVGRQLLEVLGWTNFISPGWYSPHCHCPFLFLLCLSLVKNK